MYELLTYQCFFAEMFIIKKQVSKFNWRFKTFESGGAQRNGGTGALT